MRLKVALIQFDIAWEDQSKNMSVLESIFEGLESDTDLVVLPEMFLSGFSMDTELIAVSNDSSVFMWMQELTRRCDVALLGTLAIKENAKVYNRAVFVKPDGTIQYYDKKHLFRMGAEQKCYESGNERVVFTYKGFRILPQVCYDLRFPVWSRNKNDYDVLVCMANWPAVRQKVWDVLLSARAIENQSYVIGVNRVGMGGGLSYNGCTKVINFKGDVIAEEELNTETIVYSQINLEKLQQFKKKFPTYLDADDFIMT